MKKKTIISLATILIIISVTLLVVSLTGIMVIQGIKTLDIQLTVANKIGFNIDTDKIYFGSIPPGNSGQKRVILENMGYKKSVVRLKVRGQLKEWITVSDNNFILKKGESKLIEIKAVIPEDAELKDYEDKLVIIYTRF
ncbi:MAG: hypothetical protein KKA79_03685 [Nanoarchaeota archaeon]|nr:hypothetical protein [Nanoarchaeota archaeon]